MNESSLYDTLVKIAQELEQEYKEHSSHEWETSPFAWLKAGLPSRTIGKIGEEFVKRLCEHCGIQVKSASDTDADLVIGKCRVEVKFSTLWESGSYKFQQIRNQNYDYLIALGISPNAAHCWVVSKDTILTKAKSQHLGEKGSETFWVEINPTDSSKCEWLTPPDGSLEKAITIIREKML
ncbi:MAG: hypothetical protein N2663_02880 [Chlorobi bacterium]|nr:hypothetical protein [Chlorobiota bacterium]